MAKVSPGSAIVVVGNLCRILATGEQTSGAYAAFEFLVPSGAGAPPHIHHREEEAFYILEGQLSFTVADRTVEVPAGMFLHAPRDVPHSFVNKQAAAAKMLVWAVPAGLEKFFLKVGGKLPAGVTCPPPPTAADIEKLTSVAPRYGLEILPPRSG